MGELVAKFLRGLFIESNLGWLVLGFFWAGWIVLGLIWRALQKMVRR